MKTKIKKIFTRKNFIWIALLLIIIVSLIMLFINFNKDKYIINKHDMYYYIMDVKFELQGKIKLDRNKEITQLTVDDDSFDLSSAPLYYKDDARTLFPKNMNVIFPTTGKQKKANYYTTVYNEVGDLFLKDRSYHKLISNAIMYDGKDLYYLIDKCTVSFDDKKIELNPMSYVIVDVLNDAIYIYNYDKDEILHFTNSKSNVIISTENYSINATLDILYYNGGSRLLIRNVDQLSNIK